MNEFQVKNLYSSYMALRHVKEQQDLIYSPVVTITKGCEYGETKTEWSRQIKGNNG